MPDLSYLGPLLWRPDDAPVFELPDTESATWRLADHRGRNVVVLFFLGGGCAHCMQQLQEFGKEAEALARLDADLVAVSSDNDAVTRALKHNSDGVAFPMPLLADPTLEIFKRYRCHDDFEHRPLHGTFFVDRQGKVRFQRISADPFLDVAFLEQEIGRINRLAGRDRGGSAAH